jgi:hypothetical protein
MKQHNFVNCPGRKNVALFAIYILIALHTASLFSGLYHFLVISELVSNPKNISEWGNINVELFTVFFPFKVIAHFIFVCLFLIWFYRVYKNHQFLINKPIFSKGFFRRFFSRLWRLITFMLIRWLWRIYELMSEIWQGKNYNPQFIEPLAFRWSVMMVVSGIYWNNSDNVWLKLEEELPPLCVIPTIRTGIASTLLADILWLLTYVLTIKFIKGIQERQTKAYEEQKICKMEVVNDSP